MNRSLMPKGVEHLNEVYIKLLGLSVNRSLMAEQFFHKLCLLPPLTKSGDSRPPLRSCIVHGNRAITSPHQSSLPVSLSTGAR